MAFRASVEEDHLKVRLAEADRGAQVDGLGCSQHNVARDIMMGRVEIHLGLGVSCEATVAPTDLYVPSDGSGMPGSPLCALSDPFDLGLTDRIWRECEAAEAVSLAPVPRGIDTQPQELASIAAQYEVRSAQDS